MPLNELLLVVQLLNNHSIYFMTESIFQILLIIIEILFNLVHIKYILVLMTKKTKTYI